MRITQLKDRLVTTHVSGPISVFLEFTVLDGHGPEPEFEVSELSPGWPVENVKAAIRQGIEAAGGTGQSSIRSVRILGSDTPSIRTYRHLAHGLASHLQQHPINAEASA